MSKSIRADFRYSTVSQLKKALSDEQLSYVLITCSKPRADGKMDVEMDYEGDPDLIAYLVKNAEEHLE